jgi:predicted negative regulator of RcsB-dependent stress response
MESNAGQLPLSHKAWAWFEANKKQVLWGGGAVLVVGVIVAFFLYRQNEEEVTASQALSKVSVPHLTGAGAQGDTAEAYLKVAAEYPKTHASARAVLLAAGALFVEGKYAEAKTQFERFRREHRDSPFVAEAQLGIAACLDAQGKAREAIAAYKDLIDNHPGEVVLPQARFALACLYEAQNEPELARTLFTEVESGDRYGALGPEAGMRLEELKSRYPRLATPATPTTNSTLLPITGGKK